MAPDRTGRPYSAGVLLESVPNVSEGSDAGVIAAIATAFERVGTVLDVHSDADHDRSVYTLVAASDAALVDAVVTGVAAAVARIDLSRHDGVHPRVGAADVVPIVPLAPEDEPRAVAVALEVGRRIGAELGVPVFTYGAIGDGRRPVHYRRGGLAELARRLEQGEISPAFGPPRLHPTAGAALVGVRPPLVAFNVELSTPDVEVARAIAAVVRAADGGLPGVQAIGLLLARTGNAQVSINLVDIDATPLHVVVEHVRDEAARRGVEVTLGELVGLLPTRVVLDAAGSAAGGLPDAETRARAAQALLLPALPASSVLELRLACVTRRGGGSPTRS
jgi:glutamate formiminotransferase